MLTQHPSGTNDQWTLIPSLNTNANASNNSNARSRTHICSITTNEPARSCANIPASRNCLRAGMNSKRLGASWTIIASWLLPVTSRSRRWPMTKSLIWKNEFSISSAKFKSPCFRRTRMKIEMPLSKFAPGQAAARPRFSPPIFTACTIATQNLLA